MRCWSPFSARRRRIRSATCCASAPPGCCCWRRRGHAAVATAVALARTRGLAPFAGLVNAVLRRVAEAGAAALAELEGRAWIRRRGCGPRGGTRRAAIALAHQHEAPLDLTLRPGARRRRAVMLLPTGSRAVSGRHPRRRDCRASTAAISGCRTPPPPCRPRLLAARRWRAGRRSLCRARRQDGAACRRRRIGRRRRARPRASGAAAREPAALASAGRTRAGRRRRMDAWPQFDAVLLDAPCSATGTIRRHPDVPHLKRPRDVRALAETQDRLLHGRRRDAASGRPADLLGVLAAAGGGRARVSRLRLRAAVCGTTRSRRANLPPCRRR